MADRVELWSCGGGRQSAGIAALITLGELPRPDHVCMVALEWEVKAVWRYVTRYIRPAMTALGIPFTIISRKKYSRPGMFWEAADGGTSLLLPSYTDQSGQPSKLPELCSGKWKQEVSKRWSSEQPGWKDRGVDCWVGISWDEQHRRRAPRSLWFQPSYPLLDVRPTRVSGCIAAVERVGWSLPPRSRCHHCPNQSDAEWSELTPEEFERACQTDEYIRTVDPHAFLHKTMIPLRQVQLKPESGGLFSGGCSSGMCF